MLYEAITNPHKLPELFALTGTLTEFGKEVMRALASRMVTGGAMVLAAREKQDTPYLAFIAGVRASEKRMEVVAAAHQKGQEVVGRQLASRMVLMADADNYTALVADSAFVDETLLRSWGFKVVSVNFEKRVDGSLDEVAKGLQLKEGEENGQDDSGRASGTTDEA